MTVFSERTRARAASRLALPWKGGGGRREGGRVIAIGTTAVRAVESVVGPDEVVRAAEGGTDLVVTPERGVRVADGLLTGLHEPEASHLLVLEAIAGPAATRHSYDAALRGRCLWHESGDTHLVLPSAMSESRQRPENPHTEHCDSNCG